MIENGELETKDLGLDLPQDANLKQRSGESKAAGKLSFRLTERDVEILGFLGSNGLKLDVYHRNTGHRDRGWTSVSKGTLMQVAGLQISFLLQTVFHQTKSTGDSGY